MGYTFGDPVAGTTRGRNGIHGDDTAGCVLQGTLSENSTPFMDPNSHLCFVMFSFFLHVPTSFPITLPSRGVSHWKGTGLTGERPCRLGELEPEFPPSEVNMLPNGSANYATPKTKTHKPF